MLFDFSDSEWHFGLDGAIEMVNAYPHTAVKDALAFIEKHALFTRTGPQGIRQVNVRGLVGAAFTHRDSRAGDPDLHTHVAVANKVQTFDGRWLSIDGRGVRVVWPPSFGSPGRRRTGSGVTRWARSHTGAHVRNPITALSQVHRANDLAKDALKVVELRGLEPLTFSLRTRRATNCAIAPRTGGPISTETLPPSSRGGLARFSTFGRARGV